MRGLYQGVRSGVHFIPLSIMFPRFIHRTVSPVFSSFLRLNRIALQVEPQLTSPFYQRTLRLLLPMLYVSFHF